MTGKTSSCGLHFVEPNRKGILVVSDGMDDGDTACRRWASAEGLDQIAATTGNPLDMIAEQEAENGIPFAFQT